MTRYLVPALLTLGACHLSTVEVGTDLERVLDMPAIANRDVDLLFVVDNSPSMLDKQLALVASFPKMMDALGTLDGGLPNLHIGVVTSDMGTMGTLDSAPGPSIGSGPGSCTGHGNDGALQSLDPVTQAPIVELAGAHYISDIGNADGSRTRNYTGQLRDVFTKAASVGANGCGFEQHFASMKRALENPNNGDFLRPEANLAVVIVADEDDCSLAHSTLMGADTSTLGPLQSFRCTHFGIVCDDGGTTTDEMNQVGPKSQCHPRTDSGFIDDVSPFGQFLVDLKGDPRAVMVGAIAGPTSPVGIELVQPPGGGTPIPALAHSCSYPGMDGLVEVADPAIRIHALVDLFPGRSAFSSVCGDDLSLPLSSLGYTAKKLVGDPCIDTPLADTSSAPGIQPQCEVVDGTIATPPCDGTNDDHCWQVVSDAAKCTQSPDHLRFELLRTAPPVAGYISVNCVPAP